MNCKTAAENFSAYIDDELNADEKLSFEEHIKNCGTCRRELEEMMQIVSLCGSLPQQELPAAFRSELHEKLVAASNGQGKKGAGLRKSKVYFTARAVASIAAGILLIFLAGVFYKYGFLAPTGTKNDTAGLTASTEKAKAAKAGGAAGYANETQAAGQESASDQSEAVASDAATADGAPAGSAAVIGAIADRAPASGAVNGASPKRATAESGADTAAAAGKLSASARDTLKNAGNAKVVESSRSDGSGSAAAGGGGAVSGRSTANAPLENQAAASTQEAKMVKVNNSLSTITILSDDTAQQEEKIKALVIENGGKAADKLVIYSAIAPSATAKKSAASTGQAIIDNEAVEANGAAQANDAAQAAKEMKFLVPVAQYEKFTAALNAAFGAANIQMGAVVTEDSTGLLNSELLTSSRLGSKIAELQKSGSTENTKEIEQLTAEKADVDGQISKLKLEASYVQVTILVNSK